MQIKLCHNLLIDTRGKSVQETDTTIARPPMNWKKSCAAILAQTVRYIYACVCAAMIVHVCVVHIMDSY